MEKSATSSLPADRLLGRTVLLVEDEPLIALDVIDELESAGARVIRARTPQAACDAIDRHQLSAAVVDFHLGDDGAEAVVARLRIRKVPFLFYTGSATDELAGTAPIVKKPAPSGFIAETLAQMLARS